MVGNSNTEVPQTFASDTRTRLRVTSVTLSVRHHYDDSLRGCDHVVGGRNQPVFACAITLPVGYAGPALPREERLQPFVLAAVVDSFHRWCGFAGTCWAGMYRA